MDWEWPLVGEGNRRLVIRYQDQLGGRAEGEIVPIKLAGTHRQNPDTGEVENQVTYVDAYCIARGAERRFSTAGILEIIDAETGKVENLTRWIRENLRPDLGKLRTSQSDGYEGVAPASFADIESRGSGAGPAPPQRHWRRGCRFILWIIAFLLLAIALGVAIAALTVDDLAAKLGGLRALVDRWRATF